LDVTQVSVVIRSYNSREAVGAGFFHLRNLAIIQLFVFLVSESGGFGGFGDGDGGGVEPAHQATYHQEKGSRDQNERRH